MKQLLYHPTYGFAGYDGETIRPTGFDLNFASYFSEQTLKELNMNVFGTGWVLLPIDTSGEMPELQDIGDILEARQDDIAKKLEQMKQRHQTHMSAQRTPLPEKPPSDVD